MLALRASTASLGVVYLQRVFEGVIQFHDGCLVSTAVAVVRSTKDGHHVLVMTPVVALNRHTACRTDMSSRAYGGKGH